MKFALAFPCALLCAVTAMAENRIDTQRPDAPELAAYGPMEVGVRTMEFVNPGQVDVLAIDAEAPLPDPLPVYDRALTVEIWYPARPGSAGETASRAFLRDGTTEITLEGRAMRDVPVAEGRYPLVIISHGYPGNRFLLSHLGENLASKGYVVASIDHRDSTYRDRAAFGSTLRNRPLDQLFVLDQMARLDEVAGDFQGRIDSDTTAIVGYSMGGYGAIVTAGGGLTRSGAEWSWGAPHQIQAIHRAGSETHGALPDPRVKTVVAFGPWGRAREFWDAETLKGVQIPMLYIAGSVDDVSGYEDGIRKIWAESASVDRALLTYENAGHNAGAPMPAPAESRFFSDALGFSPFDHYADAVWDTVRMNNIAQHFVTAWLMRYLGGSDAADPYLDLVPVGVEGVWSVADDGSFTDAHSYWHGFQRGKATGLRFEWLEAGE